MQEHTSIVGISHTEGFISMICEHCGEALPETSTVCPACGTPRGKRTGQHPTIYGKSPHENFGGSSPYKQVNTGAYTSYMPPQMYEEAAHQASYKSSFASPHQFSAHPHAPRITPLQTPNLSNALTIEVVLSLIGIFGVGWLMAGQITIGILLLLGSIFFYWPMLMLSTMFTDGLSLLCLVPMAIGLIIFNAVLLNGYIKRKIR
jgi:hypothetical protein